MRVKGPSILNVGWFEPIPGRRRRSCINTVFGVHLIAFRFHALLVTKIVLLSVGPFVIACLGYLLLQRSASTTFPSRVLWRSYCRGYGRFWLAFILGVITQAGLVVGFLKLNPNVRSLTIFQL
jgi:hypothetical protein